MVYIILMRNQPITPSRDNPIFFLWNAPTLLATHKNWKHPNIRIITRTFAGRPDQFVPTGYTAPTGFPAVTGFPLTKAHVSGLAVAAALTTAHIIHAQGLIRGYGAYNSGIYDGGVFLQNWGYNSVVSSGGNGSPVCALVGNPADRIADVYREPNIATASGRSPYSLYSNWATGNCCDITLIMTSGIEDCKYHSQVFFAKLKEYCDNYTDPRGKNAQLCYPKFICNDTELVIDNLLYYRPSGAVDIGHRLSLQKDPRYSTATIYQKPNGTGWTNITMSGAEALLTLNLNPLPTWFAESSSGFIQWWYRTAYSVLSYACEKALYEPAREIFPEIKSLNYHSYEVPNPAYPHIAYTPRNWERLIQPVVREDYSSPDLYPSAPTGVYYTQSGNDTKDNSIYFNITNSLVPMVSGSSTKGIIPWIMATGAESNDLLLDLSYLSSYLKHCYDANISEYILWGNPSSSPVTWADDCGFQTAEYMTLFFKRHKTGSATSGFTREL